jgi:chemotaxis signal transduction protein
MLNNLRTRRFASCPVEQTQAIVVFQLGQQAFGLPIAAVRRVIPLETVYGNAQQQGLCLAQHLDQDVVLLDVKLCLLGQAVTTPMGTDDQPAGQYLLLLNVSGEEQMGLPIEGEPQIVRLPESALAPIPETYRRKGNVRCLSSRMAKIEGRAPILLLEAETLVENHLDWLAAQPTAKPKSSVSNAVDVVLVKWTPKTGQGNKL